MARRARAAGVAPSGRDHAGSGPAAVVGRGLRRGGALPGARGLRMPGTKVQKVAAVLPAADLHETYVILASHTTDPARIVPGAVEPPTVLSSSGGWPVLSDPVEAMMYLDTMTYLPDDILTKVDRATMASSLEGRMPFLDPDVAAWRGACLPTARCERARENGCCVACCTGTSRPRWSNVPRRASASPSATGSGARCARGPKTSSTSGNSRTTGSSRSRWCVPCGPSTCPDAATGQFDLWDVLMLQSWLRAQGPVPRP